MEPGGTYKLSLAREIAQCCESPNGVRGAIMSLGESQGHKFLGRRQYNSFLISCSLNEGGVND
jgi:hypothetical protein